MPHGSGGGSHGGGSHHSSHHSSHGGGHGATINRVSNRPYAGARRYRYRTRTGGSRYVYCTSAPKPTSIGTFIFSMIFMIPFVFVGVTMILLSLAFAGGPYKLKGAEGNGTYIEDNIHVIDNQGQLNDTMAGFEDETGVVPYIITTTNEQWEGNYSDLESYAYDLYVNHFYDEDHFLIVYSEPEQKQENGYVDWYWEGMQGDNTDSIISEEHFSEFQNDLQRYLTMDDYSVGQAMETAFSAASDYMMEKSNNMESISMILFGVFWLGITIFMMWNQIAGFVRSRRAYEEAPMQESQMNQNLQMNQNVQTNQTNQGMGTDVDNSSRGYILNGEYHAYDCKNKDNF